MVDPPVRLGDDNDKLGIEGGVVVLVVQPMVSVFTIVRSTLWRSILGGSECPSPSFLGPCRPLFQM